jgi:2-polyprenyl-3-methyl-5-hydroxy-6-metoxy-1,4-benzoquinol methylase
MMPDLSTRYDGPELMDAPDCDPEQLYRTLDQFGWMNVWVSRYRTCLKRWIVSDMEKDPSRAYHLVDLGAGGCDIAAWFVQMCGARGLQVRVTAVDADPRTTAWAQARYGGIAGLDIVCGDASEIGDLKDVDYVYANHFLHHLNDDEIVGMLARIGAVAQRQFVISDLARSWWSYWGFSVAGRMVLRDSFALRDGRVSIRKGFRREELRRMMGEAGVRGEVVGMVPGRVVVVGGKE